MRSLTKRTSMESQEIYSGSQDVLDEQNPSLQTHSSTVLASLKGNLPRSKTTNNVKFAAVNKTSTAHLHDPKSSSFVTCSDLEMQKTQLRHRSNLLNRPGSKLDLTGPLESRNTMQMNSSQSITPLKPIAPITRNATDEDLDNRNKAAKEIEKVLKKAQRKIDARLDKAEDNLFKTNQSLYKAKSSQNTGSTFSIFEDDGFIMKSEVEPETNNDIMALSASHILEPIRLPPIGSTTTLAKKRYQNTLQSAKSNHFDVSKKDATSRLTDPSQYPPAYKAKLEVVRKHSEMNKLFKSMDKLSTSRSSSLNLSMRDADMIKRLADPIKSKSRSSLDRIDFSGYPADFQPVSEAEKERLRLKTYTRGGSHIDFFSKTTSPNSSKSGSRRASIANQPKTNPGSDAIPTHPVEVEILKPKKSSMSGFVEDMGPPRPPYEQPLKFKS
ncbi:hypothetical protein QVD99_003996 [Batrachochytrium dendrobatidis]|nr:hypothetical protein O5D80_002273 [Batrachochytrium dendrobatidis]KAK5669605.1 hypothetical protein QVD99_003996 [Batrachochytrium dendrobatidis]